MEQSLTAGFLIFPGFPMACLTSMIEPLRAANEISGKSAFKWHLISEVDGKVLSSADLMFEPSMVLSEARDFDFLILLSAPTANFLDNKTPAHLRALSRHGTVLGAVSGGVFPLVRAGLGTREDLAVHWCYRAAFDAEFPNAMASDRVIERRDTLITAAGAAAAFDLALDLIERRLGVSIATEVACWFQHPVMRREGVTQAIPLHDSDGQGGRLPPLVARAVERFSQNMEEPLSVNDLAGELEISPRHMERAFKQATGLSPSHYYRKMRMEAARQIVLYTNDKLADVAGGVGYGSVQTFAKHYEAAFGLSPADDRKRINLFRVEGNRPVPSI